MACALVPFGRLRDLGAARDFLCPQRRHGGAAGGGECGKGGSGLPGGGEGGRVAGAGGLPAAGGCGAGRGGARDSRGAGARGADGERQPAELEACKVWEGMGRRRGHTTAVRRS